MSNKFVILHLSDAHIGQPGRERDSLSVLEPLLEDIEYMHNTYSLTPNLIIFTGDLAFGEHDEISIKDQYKKAKDFLTAICKNAETDINDVNILLVPGNHDINRTKITTAQKQHRNNLEQDEVNNILQKQGIDWKDIVRKQSEWLDFYKTLQSGCTIDENFLSSTLIIEHDNKKIGIVGLNSSWASYEQDEIGKLWIGKEQYDKSLQAVKKSDFRIIAFHHPIDWLHQSEKSKLKQHINSDFQLYFHGHEHDQWFNDSNGHLVIEAGACYEGSEKENGYSWVEIDFNKLCGKIYLRKYSDSGGRGWIPNIIPNKSNDNGVVEVEYFLKKKKNTPQHTLTTNTSKTERTCATCPSFCTNPKDLKEYIKMLEDNFHFRWEPHNFKHSSESTLVYWPVKLRYPTLIHASQCFAAAGLQKYGCKIYLWIDNLGNTECEENLFIEKMNDWFARAGGNPDDIIIKRFSEEENSDNAHEMIDKWLVSSRYKTEQVLQISKIIAPNATHEKILNAIKTYRPRRLLTPSMVWACLLTMHNENNDNPIITLGGYDERELWEAWRDCVNISSTKVGNLFVSKLMESTDDSGDIVRMYVTPLIWTSKRDILEEFNKDIKNNSLGDIWEKPNRMISWCVNNCILLPNCIKEAGTSLKIDDKEFHQLSDLKPVDLNLHLNTIVEEVSNWLLG